MSIIEKLFEKDVSKTVKKDNFDEHSGGTSSVDKQNISRSVEPDHGNDKHEKTTNVQINYERLKSFGFLTPDIMNITLAEQYRRIKQPILLNAFHDGIEGLRNGNLVMVTSSLPSEGKTFTSFNLAMSVANEFNHSVLYVDADVAKQTITSCLGFTEKAGLTDYLVNENLGLSDLIIGTDIVNLKILPAGGQHDRITELWASSKMQALLSEMSQRYKDRLIIFDAPPVLSDSSASILSRIVGQVILVIEAEKTPQHVLEETLNIIKDSQYIGLILNKSNQKQSSDYGYYANV